MQPVLKSVRNAGGDVFCFNRLRAGKMFVHRVFEQGNPAVKMLSANRQQRVLWPRPPLIGVCAKQERVPELIQERQMFLPVNMGNVIEDGREQRVGIDLMVK